MVHRNSNRKPGSSNKVENLSKSCMGCPELEVTELQRLWTPCKGPPQPATAEQA